MVGTVTKDWKKTHWVNPELDMKYNAEQTAVTEVCKMYDEQAKKHFYWDGIHPRLAEYYGIHRCPEWDYKCISCFHEEVLSCNCNSGLTCEFIKNDLEKCNRKLIETNPYLNSPDRERLIKRSVDTSCGVEGIGPNRLGNCS